jgi:hypothetical protein
VKLIIAVFVAAGCGSSALAGSILVVGETTGDIWAQTVGGHLTSFGDTPTIVASLPGSLAGYDQVWDVRYSTSISASDKSAFGAFLAGGGRMFVMGEGPAFATRNGSITSFLSDVGAGSVTLQNVGSTGWQTVTTDGQILNNPNSFTDVHFDGANLATSTGSGFLVTKLGATSSGSIVGWDFGDISGKASARMLACFDSQVLSNHSGWSSTSAREWTRNMRDYLAPEAVPLPTTAGLAAAGLAVLGIRRRRCFV